MADGNWRAPFSIGVVAGVVLAVFLFLVFPDQSLSWFSHDGSLVNFTDTFANWMIAFFSVVASALLWLTLLATQRMALDAREVGEAGVRAYISSTTVLPLFSWNDEELAAVHLIPRVVNTGQSPAQMLGLYSFSALLELQERPNVHFDPVEAQDRKTLGAGNEYNMVEHAISVEAAHAVWKGERRLFLLGWISYSHVFTRNREPEVSTFCYEVMFRYDPCKTKKGSEGGLLVFHSRPDYFIGPSP